MEGSNGNKGFFKRLFQKVTKNNNEIEYGNGSNLTNCPREENDFLIKVSENLEREPLLKKQKQEVEKILKEYCLVENGEVQAYPEIFSSINGGYGTSLSSNDEIKETEVILGDSAKLIKTELNELAAPKDKFFIVHMAAYFLGVTGMLPLTFFLVANDYWMYRFRDVSLGQYNLNNKTYFQTMFVSLNSACSAFPCLISVLLTNLLGHKIDGRKTLIISLAITSGLFAISTALIEVNTDTWQYPFFVLTLSIISILAFIQPLLAITNFSYLSKFPEDYIQWNLYGTAAGGLFGSTLQIISLAIGKNSIQIALIYFSTGTILMSFTCLLVFAMKYSPILQYYTESAEDLYKSKHTISEYREAAKKTWFILLMIILLMLGAGIGHPNITNLIVSEGYTGTGINLWYDKYFAVTAIYFLYDFFQLVGRWAGRPAVREHNYHWFLLLIVLRTYGIGILFWFCNAQPRNYLPVWFPHDYQYMTIMIIYSFLGSALATSTLLSIPAIAKERTEIAYVLTISSMTIVQTLASPLNPMFITLL